MKKMITVCSSICLCDSCKQVAPPQLSFFTLCKFCKEFLQERLNKLIIFFLLFRSYLPTLPTQRTNVYTSRGDIADHVQRPNYLSPNMVYKSVAGLSVHMVSVTPQLFLHKQIVCNIKLGMWWLVCGLPPAECSFFPIIWSCIVIPGALNNL